MKHTWINKPTIEKKSLSYIWEYYKFHIIFGLFALVLIVAILYSVLSNKSPDLTVHFIGNPTAKEEVVEEMLTIELKDKLTDVDNNHKIVMEAQVKSLAPYRLSKDEDQTGAMKIIEWEKEPQDADLMLVEKITLDLTAGEPALYIIDGGIMGVYMTQGIFAPLETLNLDIEEDKKLIGESELEPGKKHIYGVSLEGNKLLEKYGISTKNKYMGVRIVNEEQINKTIPNLNYKNALTAFSYIYNNR